MIEFILITTLIVGFGSYLIMRGDYDAVFAALSLAGMYLFVMMLLTYGYTQYRLSSKCLSLGYPGTSMTLLRKGYCVGRLNQSDVVVPVEQAIPMGELEQ